MTVSPDLLQEALEGRGLAGPDQAEAAALLRLAGTVRRLQPDGPSSAAVARITARFESTVARPGRGRLFVLLGPWLGLGERPRPLVQRLAAGALLFASVGGGASVAGGLDPVSAAGSVASFISNAVTNLLPREDNGGLAVPRPTGTPSAPAGATTTPSGTPSPGGTATPGPTTVPPEFAAGASGAVGPPIPPVSSGSGLPPTATPTPTTLPAVIPPQPFVPTTVPTTPSATVPPSTTKPPLPSPTATMTPQPPPPTATSTPQPPPPTATSTPQPPSPTPTATETPSPDHGSPSPTASVTATETPKSDDRNAAR